MKLHLRWLPDGMLVRRTLKGNPDAFSILVDRHLGTVHALAWSHTGSPIDADDVTQEAFLRAYTRLDTLREADKFLGWLAGIVRNLAADFRARTQRSPSMDPAMLEKLPAPAKAPDEDEIYAVVREAVLTLEDPAREVLCLHYFAEKSVQEIAGLQGVSVDAAYKRMQRAREALGRELLGRIEQAPALKRRAMASKRAILGALAGAPLAWKAAAATSGVSVSALAGVALLLAAVGAGSAAYVNRESLSAMFAPVPAPVREQTVQAVEVATVEAEPSTSPVATPGDMATADGPGRYHGHIYDIGGRPVAGARVRVERVDWGPDTLPPAETYVRETVSDADGAFELTGLPLGKYALYSATDDAAEAGKDDLTPEDHDRVLDAYLKPAQPIAGRVVNAAGAAVSGAVIVPAAYGPVGEIRNHVATMAARMYSNARGEFGKGLFWVGDWSFMVQAPGFSPALVPGVAAGTTNLKITLEAAAKVHGHVRSARDQEPAAGIQVVLQGTRELVQTTGSDGYFEFAEAPAGPVQLNIESDAATLVSGGEQFKLASGEVREVDLLLGGGATLSGRVFDKDADTPLRDAKIFVMRLVDDGAVSEPSFNRTLTLDPLGQYFATALPEGTLQVRLLMSPGFVPDSYEPREIVVKDGHDYVLDFPVRRGIPLSGHVVAGSAPSTGERLGVIAITDGGDTQSTLAEVDGSFALTLPPDTQSVDLLAGNETERSEWLRKVAISAGGRDDIALSLVEKGDATIEVEVSLDPADPRVAARALELNVYTEEDAGFGFPGRTVDHQGKYEIKNVLPGSYRLQLVETTTGMPVDITAPFKVAPAQQVRGLKLSLSKTGTHIISGTVTDDAGAPLEEARIRVAHSASRTVLTSRTDATGHFSVLNVPSGGNYVMAMREGYFGDSRQIVIGDPAAAAELPTLSFTLREQVEWHGRAVDAATGAPLAKVQAKSFPVSKSIRTLPGLYTLMNEGGDISHVETAQSEEGFSMPLARGDAFVVVAAKGYAPMGQIVNAANPETIDFPLQQGDSVSGIVRAPDGAPLPGARVSEFVNPDAAGRWNGRDSATTDVEGTFNLTGMVAGAPIYITHPAFAAAVVTTPSQGDIDVTLQPGGTISGKVVGVEPAILSTYLDVHSLRNPDLPVPLDPGPLWPGGTFKLSHVPAGVVRVSLHGTRLDVPGEWMALNVDLVVQNDGVTEVVLDAAQLAPSEPVEAQE